MFHHSCQTRQYALITLNYWAFTLTDGALRMLVILYFHNLGYSPIEIALLFIFYEAFGVVTNLLGGWIGARIGLNITMNIGLGLQILALSMLALPNEFLNITWVMMAQALSGIAKDLNKMSAKSSIKFLVKENAQNTLFRWVAFLTGSKNALKGIGFFLGGFLLMSVGFQKAMVLMAVVLGLFLILSVVKLKKDIGKASSKPKITHLFSKSAAINYLSFSRFFLFGARDVWFVIALPVYLSGNFHWDHWQIGGFLALWIIGYGIVQSLAPQFTQRKSSSPPNGKAATLWVVILTSLPCFIALSLTHLSTSILVLIIGLCCFGIIFAINSSIHSFLIVDYAQSDGISLDVGFYYMANAMGRLVGTLFSGWIFQHYGFIPCLWVSSLFLLFASILSSFLPKE